MPEALNIVHCRKGDDQYIFIYTPEHHIDAVRTIARFAANPELSLNWVDAATLCQRMKQQLKEETCTPLRSNRNETH